MGTKQGQRGAESKYKASEVAGAFGLGQRAVGVCTGGGLWTGR